MTIEDAKAVVDDLVSKGFLSAADADAYLKKFGGGGGTPPDDRGMRVRRVFSQNSQNGSHVISEIDRRMGRGRIANEPAVTRDPRHGGLRLSAIRPARVQEQEPPAQRIWRDPNTGRLHIA